MGATCWAGNAHSFRNTMISLPFGEFLISLIHYTYTLHNLSVLGLCLRIHDYMVCLPGLARLLCLRLMLFSLISTTQHFIKVA